MIGQAHDGLQGIPRGDVAAMAGERRPVPGEAAGDLAEDLLARSGEAAARARVVQKRIVQVHPQFFRACLQPELVPARFEARLVEAEAVQRVHVGQGAQLHAPDDVREAAVAARALGDVVAAVETVALSDEAGQPAVAAAVDGIVQPIVHALARTHPVAPGKAVELEQVGRLEVEVAAVLVGDGLGVGVARRRDHLHPRLQHFATQEAVPRHGQAVAQRRLREDAPGDVVSLRIRRGHTGVARIHAVGGVEIAVERDRGLEHTAQAADHAPAPAQGAGNAPGIPAAAARDAEHTRVQETAPAVKPPVAGRVQAQFGQDVGQLPRGVSLGLALEGQGARAQVVVPVEALDIGLGRKEALVAEVVDALVGVVAGAVGAEAPAKTVIDVEAPFGVHVPAENVVFGIIARFPVGDGAAAGDAIASAFRTRPVFGLERQPLFGCRDGRQRHVAVGGNDVMKRRVDARAQFVRDFEAGQEEAGLALDPRVGVREIWRVGDGNAEQLEPCVAVDQEPRLLVVDHLLRLDLPQRRPVRFVFAYAARAEHDLAHDRSVAVHAHGVGCSQARAVGEQHAQAGHRALAQVAAEFDAIGEDHFPRGLQQRDVAGGADHVRLQVVAQFLGEQDALAPRHLDVAARGHGVRLVVVDHLVGLEQCRLARLCRVLGLGLCRRGGGCEQRRSQEHRGREHRGHQRAPGASARWSPKRFRPPHRPATRLPGGAARPARASG